MKHAWALFLAAMATGCVVDEIDLSTESSEVLSSNRISLNGLTLERSVLGDVAAGPLGSADTRAPDLFTTTEGREQFSYLVSCALPADKTITIGKGKSRYTYNGSLGLASIWERSALPTQLYGRVSACMLARTNYFGVSVPISMRGSGFATTDAEKQAFTVQEGAFWGDVFTPGATMAACPSALKLSGSTISTLSLRECTVSVDGTTTKCGFSYVGGCEDVCTTDAGDTYRNCGNGTMVISVYLAAP